MVATTLQNETGTNQQDTHNAPYIDFDKHLPALLYLDERKVEKIADLTDDNLLVLAQVKEVLANPQPGMITLLPVLFSTMHSILTRLVLNDKSIILTQDENTFIEKFNTLRPLPKRGIGLVDLFIKIYVESKLTPDLDMLILEGLPNLIRLDLLVIDDLKRIQKRLRKNIYDKQEQFTIMQKIGELAFKLSNDKIDDTLRAELKEFDINQITLNSRSNDLSLILANYLDKIFALNNVKEEKLLIEHEA
jgi:hypothetical protein